MARNDLNGKRVAILATDGVEQVELTEPRKALDDAGATTVVVSPKEGRIKAWHHGQWADEIRVDRALSEASADDFDALLLPGGVMNPDRLRMDKQAVQFVRRFFRLANLSRQFATDRGCWSKPTSSAIAR
jgi:protease I